MFLLIYTYTAMGVFKGSPSIYLWPCLSLNMVAYLYYRLSKTGQEGQKMTRKSTRAWFRLWGALNDKALQRALSRGGKIFSIEPLSESLLKIALLPHGSRKTCSSKWGLLGFECPQRIIFFLSPHQLGGLKEGDRVPPSTLKKWLEEQH